MKKKKGKIKAPPATPQRLEALSRSHLDAGRFKQAIDTSRQWVELEPAGQGVEFLAQAYRGRAVELSRKGMDKEAAMILERAGNSQDVHPYSELLTAFYINAGYYGKAANLHLSAKLSPKSEDADFRDTVSELLAGWFLTGEEEVSALLSTDLALCNHRTIALEALQAYGQRDDENALQALKRLPVRSSFKSFRLFMQALISGSADVPASVRLLDKIPQTSTFCPMAEVLKQSLVGGGEALLELVSEGGPGSGLALDLVGVNPEKLALYKNLKDLSKSPEKLFMFLQKKEHVTFFPDEVLRKVCMDLLPFCVEKLPVFQKRFADLPSWELCRIRALAAEQKDDSRRALKYWGECVDQLSDDPQSDHPVMKAMIYRHMADLELDEGNSRFGERSGGFLWGDDDDDDDDDDGDSQVEWLEKSIQHDPGDRDTHLRLIALHQKGRDSKEHRLAVDRAVELFPKDSVILAAAVEQAYSSQTFKKVVGLANRMLVLDPINNPVRLKLVNAHLAHARKQFHVKRLHLVEKELAAAETVERENNRSGHVQIFRAVLALLAKQKTAGEEKLREAQRVIGHAVVADLMALAEAQRLKAPKNLLTSLLAVLAARVGATEPSGELLMRLTVMVEQYQAEKDLPIAQWLAKLAPFFEKCAGLDLSLEEHRVVCHMLRDHACYHELAAFGRTGEKRWPQDASFLFFRLVGETKNDRRKVSRQDISRLRDALNPTTCSLDARTMDGALRFVAGGGMFGTFGPGSFFDSDDDECDCDSCRRRKSGEPFTGSGMIDSIVGPVLEEFISEQDDLRREMGEAKFKKHVMKELGPGFPLGRGVLGEMLDQVLNDTRGGREEDESPLADLPSPNQADLPSPKKFKSIRDMLNRLVGNLDE